MTRPGWTYDAEYNEYEAIAAFGEHYSISLRVRRHSREDCWVADYGWTGFSFAAMTRYATPEAAADEAEAWLRGLLAQFSFPWLEVK